MLRGFYQKNKRAQSILEYMMLIAFILASMAVMKIFFERAMMGRWKSAGDEIGFGRQYNATAMKVECALDTRYHPEGMWYDVQKFESQCWNLCFGNTATYDACKGCFPPCPEQ